MKLLITNEAADKIGLSAPQFRRIVGKLIIEPVEFYKNPHYRSGPLCPLWSSEQIRKLKRRKIVKDTIERNITRRSPEEIYQEHREKLIRKYSSFDDVVPDACNSLFELNRYCKHRSCSRANKNEIYDLKSQFLARLCEGGYLVDVRTHTVRKEEKKCFSCYGSGDWYGEDCDRCEGTGVFLKERELSFIAFGFSVNGKNYCWHQPSGLVDWDYPNVNDERDSTPWNINLTPKSVSLSAYKRTSAKRLLTFALEYKNGRIER